MGLATGLAPLSSCGVGGWRGHGDKWLSGRAIGVLSIPKPDVISGESVRDVTRIFPCVNGIARCCFFSTLMTDAARGSREDCFVWNYPSRLEGGALRQTRDRASETGQCEGHSPSHPGDEQGSPGHGKSQVSCLLLVAEGEVTFWLKLWPGFWCLCVDAVSQPLLGLLNRNSQLISSCKY